ncbi:MAG TPA: thiol reductase thioredoxin [Parabacteroides sp.]|nr:thiol reductase thioredoxin [Parabacteroides sp.]
MSVIHLTKEGFTSRVADVWGGKEWRYLGDKPAIIDFFATWCGPCQALAPTLEEIAGKFKDQIYVYKVDVDEEGDLASLFNIRAVPTLLFVPMEGKPKIHAGAMSKSDLESAIKRVLI